MATATSPAQFRITTPLTDTVFKLAMTISFTIHLNINAEMPRITPTTSMVAIMETRWLVAIITTCLPVLTNYHWMSSTEVSQMPRTISIWRRVPIVPRLAPPICQVRTPCWVIRPVRLWTAMAGTISRMRTNGPVSSMATSLATIEHFIIIFL